MENNRHKGNKLCISV